MGCFSFLCKGCGKGIQSNSFSGEQAKLILLQKGKPIQEMEGQYDSYGRVFIEGSQRGDVKHSLMESQKWLNPVDKDNDDEDDAWSEVCDLMFDDDKRNGIEAWHTKCFKGEITGIRSESDPNQGWGDPDEDEDDLMGCTDPDRKYE